MHVCVLGSMLQGGVVGKPFAPGYVPKNVSNDRFAIMMTTMCCTLEIVGRLTFASATTLVGEDVAELAAHPASNRTSASSRFKCLLSQDHMRCKRQRESPYL